MPLRRRHTKTRGGYAVARVARHTRLCMRANYERMTGGRTIRDSLRMDVDVAFEPVVSRDRGRVAEL
ncbi:MAG TPA: hypothetical protein PKC73_00865 [Dermatophilaceae bacterium]|nr:hypothetical protein [Actinomycetales bacterium]HMT88159.1 hypothetical protein [Dermatophilaceae bacterium]